MLERDTADYCRKVPSERESTVLPGEEFFNRRGILHNLKMFAIQQSHLSSMKCWGYPLSLAGFIKFVIEHLMKKEIRYEWDQQEFSTIGRTKIEREWKETAIKLSSSDFVDSTNRQCDNVYGALLLPARFVK